MYLSPVSSALPAVRLSYILGSSIGTYVASNHFTVTGFEVIFINRTLQSKLQEKERTASYQAKRFGSDVLYQWNANVERQNEEHLLLKQSTSKSCFSIFWGTQKCRLLRALICIAYDNGTTTTVTWSRARISWSWFMGHLYWIDSFSGLHPRSPYYEHLGVLRSVKVC